MAVCDAFEQKSKNNESRMTFKIDEIWKLKRFCLKQKKKQTKKYAKKNEKQKTKTSVYFCLYANFLFKIHSIAV